MEKKSSIKEIHKLIPQDYPEIYKKISDILGDENPFAKFSIGAGNYIWSDNRRNWHQMIAWSSLKQEAVKEELVAIKANLNSKFGEKQTDLLLSIPDDGYIYFNDDEGDIKILITGWGFKKPLRIGGDPIIEEIVKNLPITLAFVYDGVKLPNYQFGIKLLNKARKLRTDDNGLCRLGNLCEGEKYIIYDIQNNNRTYDLEICTGQTNYEINLTKYTIVTFSATVGGEPVVNEHINILYHGSPYNVITDDSGNATIELPLYENEFLSAELRGQSKSINIHTDENHIDFEFNTEPPILVTDIIVSVMFDSNICANKDVTIEYNGKKYNGITDENGQFLQRVQIVESVVCNVSVDGYTSQQKELKKIPSNLFMFEDTTPQPTPNKVSSKLIVKRENGDIVNGYPISVETNDIVNHYITDEKGEILLPDMYPNEIMRVIDGNEPSHIEEYTVFLGHKEYVFTIPNEEVIQEQQLKLMFRNKDGHPIKCSGVKFHQEECQDISVTLDESGNVYLPKDALKIGEEITASINGWEEKFAPIPFRIDENEYEYLFQEKSSIRSWLTVFLQILAVLITIIALIILWPYLEALCASAYENLYNVPCPYFTY